MENQEKYICENCSKEHDGSYGSGRFCSDHCRRAYCVKQRKVVKCNWSRNKPKEGGWECKCGKLFRTRKELYEHGHESGHIKTRLRTCICEHCNESYVGLKKDHLKICKELPHGKHVYTDAERLRVSIFMKNFYKEHTEKCSWKYNTKFISSPCEHLKEILKQQFDIVEEYTDIRWEHNYSLDIAILDKKIAIEVNGNQHYNSNGNLTEYYLKRNTYLESFGWKVFNVYYKDCYNDEIVEKLTNEIKNDKNSGFFKDLSKHRKDRLKLKQIKDIQNAEKLKYLKSNNKITKNGIYSASVISTQEWENRKELILTCGEDLMKYGWVSKVSAKLV